MTGLRVPIHLEERDGVARAAEPVRIGVPLPRGAVQERDVGTLAVVDADGRTVPHQGQVAARWHDRSVKWLLLDVAPALAAHGRATLYVVRGSDLGDSPAPIAARVERASATIETGAAGFAIKRGDERLLASAGAAGRSWLHADKALRLRLIDAGGREYAAVVDHLTLESAGAVRADVLAAGRFVAGAKTLPLLFTARYAFFAGRGLVRIEVLVRNLQAARHPGNLWDLGDAGSLRFEDLSLEIAPATPARQIEWCAEERDEWRRDGVEAWTLYQDSSGGENWQSHNHVDAGGESTVRFRGYEVRVGDSERGAGARAQPCAAVVTDDGRLSVRVDEFWQNFPKALRWCGDSFQVALFPAESAKPFELQGGEQKRHVVWLDFEPAGASGPPALRERPVDVWIDPAAVAASGAIEHFVPGGDSDTAHAAYVDSIVAGPRSFVALRETIDEYGWRNFGDLYADHEAVGHKGPRPLVSHYNNQYDFVHAAAVRYLRHGDVRWQSLMSAGARHVVDIDVYHTDRDRPAYNGGMFWHTDHYHDAATCTHRSYSRRNAAGRDYGGGPSNEHNYTSGLLLHYFLTGDRASRATVLGLADWVVAMDDGARTLLGLVDAGPTGAATCTVSPDYHKPGRGAGNSINALLDAYAVSNERAYLAKAEALLQRCVHPTDDVAALGLGDPEDRWSYLMFFQVVGKYLDVKTEMGETDYGFYYARDCLVRYADWMLEHEVPYKDVLHKVKIPTETWSAHDMRKCHVLHLAARCTGGERRAAFAARAAFFFARCLEDLLGFETAYLTRPRVIVATCGYVHQYYVARGYGADAGAHALSHGYCLGEATAFVPQRRRARQALRTRLRTLGTELRRLAGESLGSVWRRLRPRV